MDSVGPEFSVLTILLLYFHIFRGIYTQQCPSDKQQLQSNIALVKLYVESSS